MPTCPSTPHCSGDPAWASPNGGHRAECQHPRPYDGPALAPPDLGAALGLVVVYGAAVRDSRDNPDRMAALEPMARKVQEGIPYKDAVEEILAVMGPDWVPDEATQHAMELLLS